MEKRNNLNFSELLKAAKVVHNPGDVVTEIEVQDVANRIKAFGPEEINKLQRITWPAIRNCFELDIFLEGIESMIQTVNFKLSMAWSGTLEIIFEDRNLATDRDLSLKTLFITGPNIKMKLEKDLNFQNQHSTQTYAIVLSERVFVDEDPTNICLNYPTELFTSYNECDKNYVRKTLKESFGPDFVPIWATNNMSEVSSGNVTDPMG